MKRQLSIITICYNEPNLEKTCESIVNQTWQDFEWIVIDGGSNKETLNIFEKYKDRIDVFVSEPDKGIYNACNKGINFSSGEYIIFMNAGDSFYSNDALKCSSLFLNSEEELLYGTCMEVGNSTKEDYIRLLPETLTNEFWMTGNICTQAVFVKSELFKKFGTFDENYKIVADYDLWLRFIKNNVKFKYLPIVVAKYDMNGISSSSYLRKLNLAERDEIKSKYFSKKEIFTYDEICKIKYSFIERIFSIKNVPSGAWKVVSILGIKIKLKRKI